MTKLLKMVIIAISIGSFFTVQAQDGFVVWAEGSHCDRELKFNSLKNGELGPKQVAVQKGPGADIHVAISYDGTWISFSRFKGTPKGQYDGPCDYHSYTSQTIYIAKIDNGKNLPAKPIEVGYGCWSVWASDENSKKPNAPKTLYYTTHQDKDIKKIVIQPDGSFSAPTTLHKLPNNTKYGTGGHIMASPDGRYVAIRPGGIQVWDSKTSSMVSGSGGGGCHPNWGPRSKYLIWSKNNVCRVEDGKTTMGRVAAGSGSYWQGWSNDKFYDDGKLWMIARTGNAGQNTGSTVEAKEADISGGKYVLTGKKIKIADKGTTCDIHFSIKTGPDTSLTLGAASDEIYIGKTLALTAKLVNEKDEPVSIPVNWTVSGGGTLASPTGLTNTFTSDGTEGEFTITAKAGVDVATVTFKVIDPTTLDLIAASKRVDIGKTLALTAKLVNEKNEPIDIPISWTLTGGGALASPTGTTNTFTSDGTEGEFTVAVKAGTREAKVTFSVVDPSKVPAVHIRINCGGKDVDDWKEDTPFAKGGKGYTFSGIKPAEGEYAAPEAVYQTVRHSESHSYNFDVPDGAYTVRIHFADANGGREFNYNIEGKKVLEKFDPGANKGVIKSFTVTVSDGNGLTIEAIKTGNDVFEAGIEVVSTKSTGSATIFKAPVAVSAFKIELDPNRLTVHNNFTEPTAVSVYSLSGKIVGKFQVNKQGAVNLDFDQKLTKGIYFVRLISASRKDHVGIVLK